MRNLLNKGEGEFFGPKEKKKETKVTPLRGKKRGASAFPGERGGKKKGYGNSGGVLRNGGGGIRISRKGKKKKGTLLRATNQKETFSPGREKHKQSDQIRAAGSFGKKKRTFVAGKQDNLVRLCHQTNKEDSPEKEKGKLSKGGKKRTREVSRGKKKTLLVPGGRNAQKGKAHVATMKKTHPKKGKVG